MEGRQGTRDPWAHLGEFESGFGGPQVGAGAVVEQPSRVSHAGKQAASQAKDEALAEAVAHLLNLHPAVVASGLAVTAASGVVTLRGSVPDPAMRDAAEELVRQVAGVTEVVDHLRIEHTSLETRQRR